jgi:prephenate dehydratase
MVGKPFEYLFYLDFVFDIGHKKAVEALLGQIKQHTEFFKVFGFYRSVKK